MHKPEVKFRRKRLDRGVKARTDSVFVIAAPWDIVYALAPRVVPVVLLLLALLYSAVTTQRL